MESYFFLPRSLKNYIYSPVFVLYILFVDLGFKKLELIYLFVHYL